jgi:hypothetical protein
VGIVDWSLDEPSLTAAHIDFGLDLTYGMTAPVDLSATACRTVLVGMKPGRTYHYRIVATAGSATYASDDRTLVTGAALAPSPVADFSVSAPEKMERGFIIASFWFGNDAATPFIVDTDGDVVWWYTVPEFLGMEGIGRARLSADGKNVWFVKGSNGGGLLRRVSIDTLSEQSYPGTGASHDITAVSGGTMAYLDYGENDCESIFEIDEAGTTREVFESTGELGPVGEYCHGNAVRYSSADDAYVFSDRFLGVAVVDRAGSVAWKLADRVSGGSAAWGGAQHGVELLENSVLLFGNEAGGTGLPGAVEYALDGSEIGRFGVLSSVAVADQWYGDVKRLPNGNTLIAYGRGLIRVVDPNDQPVLSISTTIGMMLGYVEFRESLYGPPARGR